MHRLRAAIRVGLATASLLTGFIAGGAGAELVELRIDASEPFAEGVAFGAAGLYQRMSGVARGELDPEDPRKDSPRGRSWGSVRLTSESFKG